MKLGYKLDALLIVLVLTTFLSGCSTGGKSSPSSSSDVSLDEDVSDQPGLEKNPMVQELSRGRSIGPKYASLGQAVRSGRGGAIVEEAGKILMVNPNDIIALNALAMYHLRRGKPGAAKILINRALEKNEPTAGLYNNLGVIFLEEGDQGAALANFKKALRINDGHAEALGNLGSLYAKGGDTIKALPLLEQSYKANRGNQAIANNYAIALRAGGKYVEAQKVYEDLVRQNSKDVAALLNYAILLIDFMNKPKDGLTYVYKVKFLETDRKDVLSRANDLEKKAKSELK